MPLVCSPIKGAELKTAPDLRDLKHSSLEYEEKSEKSQRVLTYTTTCCCNHYGSHHLFIPKYSAHLLFTDILVTFLIMACAYIE